MKSLALFTCLLIPFLVSGCSRPDINTLQGFAQGTTYTISYWADPAIPSGKVQVAARETLERIDRELSNYRDDSAIERFNRNQTTQPQTVPASLVKMVRVAGAVSAASQGCYDLTIRPLFKLWGFDDEFRVPRPPEIEAAMATVGMDRIEVLGDTRLRKHQPAVEVDVSSIAQGYTTGQIAEALESLGIRNYLVEVGGELLVRGSKPGDTPWRVAVERPLAGERKIQKVITIEPGGPLSVVTSGTYRHFYDRAGRRYSHIIDARTGAPVQHGLLSVTVLHPDPTLADAWSTALLCLGTEDALEVAEQHDLAALLIAEDGEGWREIYTPAFESDRWSIR